MKQSKLFSIAEDPVNRVTFSELFDVHVPALPRKIDILASKDNILGEKI